MLNEYHRTWRTLLRIYCDADWDGNEKGQGREMLLLLFNVVDAAVVIVVAVVVIISTVICIVAEMLMK